MGERLSGGNVAVALLANSIATGAALVTLIHTVRTGLRRAFQSGGDDSGCLLRRPGSRDMFVAYCLAQLAGAAAGTISAQYHVQPARRDALAHARTGAAQFIPKSLQLSV